MKIEGEAKDGKKKRKMGEEEDILKFFMRLTTLSLSCLYRIGERTGKKKVE